MSKVEIDDIPNKHIQIFLHPYLFEGSLDGLPGYFEIIEPGVTGFNNKITRQIKKIETMCDGLDEEHLKYSLMTCQMVLFFYSGKEIHGIMGLNANEDKLHIEIVCTNNTLYKGIGTFLIDVANEIAVIMNKTVLTLDSVKNAVPFYQKMGFKDIKRNTIPMDKIVVKKPLKALENTLFLRRSRRGKSKSKSESESFKKSESESESFKKSESESESFNEPSKSESESFIESFNESSNESSIPSYYSSDQEYSSNHSEAVFRESDNGKYSALLDMKMPQNRRFRNMEYEAILAEITAGINTTGVEIDIDNWSTGDKLLILHFRGRLNAVNNILVQMRPLVFLRRFNNGGTKTAKKRRTQKKRKDKKH